MFNNLSYKNKLLLRIMPILLAGLLAVSGSAYWYINNLIKEDLTSSMLATTGKTAESINAWLKALMMEPETVATTSAAKAINNDFRLIDNQNIERYKMLSAKYPDVFEDIYAANRKGEYHTVQQSGGGYTFFVGDISNRNYFISIMSGAGAQISRPLISRTTGKPTIFIAAPINDDLNMPQGMIGAGISIEYIKQLATDLKTGQSGYGIIVSKDGTIIHHPDKEVAMLKKVDELGDDSTRELGRRMVSGASGIFIYKYNGEEKVAFYKPIPIAGWSVATVLPESELFAPASKMLNTLAAVTVVVMFLAGIGIVLIARNLTRPLQHLALQAQELADGNLTARALDVTSSDEVGQLAAKFNYMAENLNNMLTELEQKNRSLQVEIKEREQAQVALTASEEKFSKAFSHVSDFVGIIRLRDKVYIDVNDACWKILGFRRDEIVGHTSNEFDLWVDKSVRDKAYQEVKEEGFFHNFEAYMRTKSGEKRYGLISSEGVEIGGERCVVYAWRDLTERKAAQDALSAARDELVRQEKLAILGRLSGTVSHELRNPLSIMSNAVYLLKLKLANADETVLGYLDMIKHEIENSARIIGDLLDFARTKPPNITVVKVDALIESSLKRCVIAESVQVRIDIPDQLKPLLIDQQQIEQVLQNLISNALQAMPDGGSLCISAKPVQSLIAISHEQQTINQDPGFVEIAVRDSGVGITSEDMKKLFQPLFTTKVKGIGLGLIVCKNLVEANGGRIEVESKEGQGTVFTVLLPTDH